MSLRTGILSNPNNDISHRMSRNSRRFNQCSSSISRRKLDLNMAQEIEMSLRTGILSNPNNDISHRMSRNSRRQAATAEKEQESRDAAKPKAKASSRREPAPVLPTQSDTVSPEPIVSPLPTQTTEALVPDFTLAGPAVDPMFDLFPTFDFRFNDTTTSQGFNAPGSFPSHEFPDAPFDPNIFGLTNYNAPITSEPGFSGDHFTPPDPTLFGLSADFNAQIPSGAPVEDPLQDFMAGFGPYGIPGDVGMASDIFSASTESHLENQLPLLPPPPPASPVASPAIDNAGPSAPKSRRSRHEVEEANILTSARSRAPTERKRIAEEEVSSRAQKRNRRKLSEDARMTGSGSYQSFKGAEVEERVVFVFSNVLQCARRVTLTALIPTALTPADPSRRT
ncbi:hypothetical protein B0H10DRAFT_1962992 [Mycena sp. CBHHK59/15]|nr:hypothetical protein B0H10DRAFT_1962992 [Mycena sp. CBHHK59/15]